MQVVLTCFQEQINNTVKAKVTPRVKLQKSFVNKPASFITSSLCCRILWKRDDDAMNPLKFMPVRLIFS